MNWRNSGRLLRRVQEDADDDEDEDDEDDEAEDDDDKDDDRGALDEGVLRNTLDSAKLGLLFPRRGYTGYTRFATRETELSKKQKTKTKTSY
ncbi:two-component response regulator ORR7-like isoform X1 [Harpegnathos saltator]|uniref:two-component response regulator ORR7-like isoform X1 n=1 Tax=Harpegnathos saltator TaxID=610380 RepID=UPI000DBEF082|nr:two-component response regulator ORR7-like isoform X1 [Harpegnathos saltator]